MLTFRTVLLALLSFSVLSGCSSALNTPPNNTLNNQSIIKSEKSASTKKDELTNLLVTVFSIDDYLDMAKNVNQENNSFSHCLDSEEVHRNTSIYLKEKIQKTIAPLTLDETNKYIDFLKSDNGSLFQKFYQTLYSSTEALYSEGQGGFVITIMEFYQGLSDHEMDILMSLEALPNTVVKNTLFPIDGNNLNLTKSGEFIAYLKETVQDTCQKIKI